MLVTKSPQKPLDAVYNDSSLGVLPGRKKIVVYILPLQTSTCGGCYTVFGPGRSLSNSLGRFGRKQKMNVWRCGRGAVILWACSSSKCPGTFLREIHEGFK